MKIQFDQTFKQLDGSDIKENTLVPEFKKLIVNWNSQGKMTQEDFTRIMKLLTIEEGKSINLKDACCTALLGNYEDEHIDGLEKSKRYALATKIYGANGLELQLTSEEITLIKSLVAKSWITIIVGQANMMLENIEGEQGNKP